MVVINVWLRLPFGTVGTVTDIRVAALCGGGWVGGGARGGELTWWTTSFWMFQDSLRFFETLWGFFETQYEWSSTGGSTVKNPRSIYPFPTSSIQTFPFITIISLTLSFSHLDFYFGCSFHRFLLLLLLLLFLLSLHLNISSALKKEKKKEGEGTKYFCRVILLNDAGFRIRWEQRRESEERRCLMGPSKLHPTATTSAPYKHFIDALAASSWKRREMFQRPQLEQSAAAVWSFRFFQSGWTLPDKDKSKKKKKKWGPKCEIHSNCFVKVDSIDGGSVRFFLKTGRNWIKLDGGNHFELKQIEIFPSGFYELSETSKCFSKQLSGTHFYSFQKCLKSLKMKCWLNERMNEWSNSVPPYLSFCHRKSAHFGHPFDRNSSSMRTRTANSKQELCWRINALHFRYRFDPIARYLRADSAIFFYGWCRYPNRRLSLPPLFFFNTLLWKINASFDVVDIASTHLFTGNFVT